MATRTFWKRKKKRDKATEINLTEIIEFLIPNIEVWQLI